MVLPMPVVAAVHLNIFGYTCGAKAVWRVDSEPVCNETKPQFQVKGVT
jgi:hypothetical protein